MSKKPETIFTSSDPNVIVARLLSLKDVVPVAYHRHGPHQSIEIEQDLDTVLCPGCKVRARVKDRPRVPYIDLPVYGRPMGLIWRKHRWYCPNHQCDMGSWTSQDKRIASRRCRLTTRAAKWATRQVGMGRTISEVAAELGCDWHTINHTVTVYGQALLDADRKRLSQTSAIGLDETRFVRLKQTPYPICDHAMRCSQPPDH